MPVSITVPKLTDEQRKATLRALAPHVRPGDPDRLIALLQAFVENGDKAEQLESLRALVVGLRESRSPGNEVFPPEFLAHDDPA